MWQIGGSDAAAVRADSCCDVGGVAEGRGRWDEALRNDRAAAKSKGPPVCDQAIARMEAKLEKASAKRR